jgi:hypothetical protein
MVSATKSIWSKVDALHKAEGAIDAGFTIEEYAAKYALSYQGAYGRLKRFVAEGKLAMGWRFKEGRKIRVFRFPE